MLDTSCLAIIYNSYAPAPIEKDNRKIAAAHTPTFGGYISSAFSLFTAKFVEMFVISLLYSTDNLFYKEGFALCYISIFFVINFLSRPGINYFPLPQFLAYPFYYTINFYKSQKSTSLKIITPHSPTLKFSICIRATSHPTPIKNNKTSFCLTQIFRGKFN